ncbi:hypothetical protein [Microbacterium tumbae]
MQTTLGRVFIHGSGRRGADAWPAQADSDGEFVGFSPGSGVADQARMLSEEHPGALVFAHSIGAVPAVVAAHAMNARGLVLVEPALYDIARGEPAIERHIGIVTEARAQAEAGALVGFWGMLRPLMFGGPFDPALWDEERALAERWATTNLPWGHGVRAEMLDGIPALVVTGGWNDEYELIASVLASRDARHEVLPGARHRPQDVPGFGALVTGFEASLAAS